MSTATDIRKSTFYYEAAGNGGLTSKGTIAARDRHEAARLLAAKDLQPFVLEERASSAASPDKARVKGRNGKSSRHHGVGESSSSSTEPDDGAVVRLKPAQLIYFSDELSDLLGAGLQLEPALRSMEERGEESGLKIVASRVRAAVRDGTSFADALRSASPSFSDLFCSLVYAGEVSGALPDILRRQVEYLKTIQALKGKVIFAMIYPAFLVLSGVLVCGLFATHLIPKLTSLMNSTGAEMPAIAKAIVGASDFLKAWGWLLGLVIAGGAIAFFQAVKMPQHRPWWDRTKLQLPLVGPMLRSNFYVQFLETLANLVQNGMPLLRSVELVRNATPNLHLRERLGEVSEAVGEGVSLSRSLERSTVFPRLLTDMVRVGEQTGDMGMALEKTADRFDKELEKKIEKISALIQPVIILLMAAIVGTMAYLMITVIYDTISTLRSR